MGGRTKRTAEELRAFYGPGPVWPSWLPRRRRPYGRIQWQGTNVCIDLYCRCGAGLHADMDFFFCFRCGECGQVYECDPHIALRPLDFPPDRPCPTISDSDDDAVPIEVVPTA